MKMWENFEELDLDERVVLKWDRQNVIVWTVLIWFIIGVSAGSLNEVMNLQVP
jgi:hypothetical protein